MAKVFWHTTMSLDGCIAGPGGTMDWMRGFTGPAPRTFEDIIARTGAALAGRNSYDSGARIGQKIYGGALQGPVFVLTRNPPPDGDPDVTFLTGDLPAALATAEAAAAGKDVVLVGGVLGRECLAAGLLDEVLVHGGLHDVLLSPPAVRREAYARLGAWLDGALSTAPP